MAIIGFGIIQPTYLYAYLYSCKYISLDLYSAITTSKEEKIGFHILC